MSPAALFNSRAPLVRQHFFELRLVGRIGDDTLAKLAFTRAGFGGEDVAGKCMITDDFARTRLPEPFGRTLVRL